MASLFVRPERTRKALYAVVVFFVVLLFVAHRSQDSIHERWRGLMYKARPGEQWRQCNDTSGLQTRLLGGSPGFYFLENVWYHNETFYLVSSDPTSLPNETAVLSPRTNLVIHEENPGFPKPDFCFAGSTIWFNEGANPSGWNGLWHYYHTIAEDMLGGFGALGTALDLFRDKPVTSETFISPWHDTHDKWHLNDLVLESVWGKENMIDDQLYKVLDNDHKAYMFFERIVIVDRNAAHRYSHEVNLWNKMAADIFVEPRVPHFFDVARRRLLDAVELAPEDKYDHKERIVYITRQDTDRKLEDEVDAELVREVTRFAKENDAEFEVLRLSDYKPAQQIRLVGEATIMMGIHGNGLTHEMWMPASSAVIEFFPLATYLRDYEIVAEALGHKYFAVINDTIRTPQNIHDDPGEKNPGRVHDGTTIHLHVPLVMDVLAELIQ